jgi:hypothetical protein
MPSINLLEMIEKRLLAETRKILFFYGRGYLSDETVERYRSVADYLIRRDVTSSHV